MPRSRKISLTRGQFAIVDAEDHERLRAFRWRYTSNGYAARSEGRRTVLMHIEVKKPPKGLEWDHWDGNGLNNRKRNLKACTHDQNCSKRRRYSNNRTGHKGIFFRESGRTWEANIGVNNKVFYLGRFKTKMLAIRAYRKAAIKHHGEFARF